MKRTVSPRALWPVWAITVLLLAACGNDNKSSSTTPPGSTQVVYGNILAFRNSTTLSWGYNGFGQLGINSTSDASTPVAVGGVPGMTGLAVGGYHSLAFNNHSTLAWGYNSVGQIALDPAGTTYRTTPVRMANFSSVTAMAAGGGYSLAVKRDGTLWAWGGNAFGQLGNGTFTNTFTPGLVKTDPLLGGGPLANVAQIAAGGAFSLALVERGGVKRAFAWGDNTFGQLGDGSTITSAYPRLVLGLPDPTDPVNATVAVAAGGSHSMALTLAGEVWTWGYNFFGQLGNGTTATSIVPIRVIFKDTQNTPIQPQPTIVAIAAGLDHSLALAADGTLWAWGANTFGQLGVDPATTKVALGANLSISLSMNPLQVPTIQFRNDKKIDGLHSLLAIGNRSYAYSADGKLRAWGDNSYGGLGNGAPTTNPVFTPVLVSGY